MAHATSFEASMIARSDVLVGTLARAADYAAGQGHPAITLEHLLLALTEDDDAAAVLVASSVDLARLRNEVAAFIGQQPPTAPARSSPVPDAELTKILTYAEAAARQSGRTEINGAIVLAAILGEGRSMAATFLKAQGLTFQAAIKIIQQVLAPTPAPGQDPGPAEEARPAPTPSPAAPQSADPAAPVVPAPSVEEPGARGPTPVPEAPRAPREVLGIPSIRPDPPTPPPAPRVQPPHIAEPRKAPPAPAPQPPAAAPQARVERAPPPEREPAAPSAAPPAPAPSPRPDPTPARAPTQVAPAAPGRDEARPSPPSTGDLAPPHAQRLPPRPAAQPPPVPPRPAAGSSAEPPPVPPRQTRGTAVDAGPGSSSAGLGALRPAPPRPGLRLPPNPLEGHQITAPWPEPTNDYRAPQVPPSYPPPRPPAGRAAHYPPDPRAARDATPRRSRAPSPSPPGRPQSVEKGQLVENIPRRMKVGVAETFEIRIARDGMMEVGQVPPGRTEPQYHAVRVIRAMSVRLKGEPGRFYIESTSPETQWTGMQIDQMAGDHAVWRFTVIPQLRGPAELNLIVATRSIGTDGVAADSNLPEQRITVRVSANVTRGLKRWAGWAAVAVLGAALGKVGESAWEPIVALLRRLLAI